jgi:undecaprenyl diphosphate synthase
VTPETSLDSGKRLHVAIIMDGNGRWAMTRGLPRTAGHRAGARSVRRTVEAAPSLGIGTLTLYAFSADNWKRPPVEVNTLLGLLEGYLAQETEECVRNGVRLSFIGRRDRLPLSLCAAVERAENATAAGARLHVRIAVDYSSREAILDAVLRLRADPFVDRPAFERALAGPAPGAAEVDLLIRTGGEQRLSDFLLWECAYAELYFTPVPWPEFERRHLEQALDAYRRRERRFGAVPAA